MSLNEYTLTQQKIIVIAPVITGSLSLISSLTIMAMMLKSKKKLSSSYRRLIFGLSMADVVFSIGQVVSTLPMYHGTVWGAMGNQKTCEAQGILLYFGAAAGNLYMMFLSIYFFTAIYFPMSKKYFARKVEPFFHLCATLYSSTTVLYLFVKKYFNPGNDSLTCWISSFPIRCSINGPIQCIRGAGAVQKRLFFAVVPIALIFLTIFFTMGMISWKAIKQAKSNKKYQFQIPNTSQIVNTAITEDNVNNNNRQRFPRRDSSSWLHVISRSNNEPSNRIKSVTIQAILYVMAFFFSWIFVCVNIIIERKHGITYVMRLMSRILNPLQGFNTMLVYTRPHVISLRRTHKEYSWLKAFFIVITSGGDDDGKVVRDRRLSRISVKIPSEIRGMDLSSSSQEKLP